ncbi:MAG: VPLPA-CTERM sorting domain-containing protein, partial [Cypionkella sp.]
SNVFTFTGVFDSLKVVDTSPKVGGRDGFDIDSISVTPATIPLPAGGLLLLGALGGVAALRRRKAV